MEVLVTLLEPGLDGGFEAVPAAEGGENFGGGTCGRIGVLNDIGKTPRIPQ